MTKQKTLKDFEREQYSQGEDEKGKNFPIIKFNSKEIEFIK